MDTKTRYYGLGFAGVLQIVLIVLKLCGVIDWNWWLVMLPLLIDAGFYVILALICFILYLVGYRYDE